MNVNVFYTALLTLSDRESRNIFTTLYNIDEYLFGPVVIILCE